MAASVSDVPESAQGSKKSLSASTADQADETRAAFDWATNSMTLRYGVKMPILGIGTWQVKGQVCVETICTALKSGYRLIDTASIYRNEADVAAGIAASGVPREDIFITSKLSPKQQGEDEAYAACMGSLKALGTSYLDLYLVHWPGAKGLKPHHPGVKEKRHATWRAMQRLLKEGHVRSIGVSNFMPHHLEALLADEACTHAPSLNQFEVNPLLHAEAAVHACKARGIAVQAYAPLAQGNTLLLQDEHVCRIAQRLQCSPAVVCIRWGLQMGYLQIPRSVNPEHIKDNLRALEVKLTDEDMACIGGIAAADGEGIRTCWDPNTVEH